ncbi:complement C1q-like protein 4 [Silurus meridionalis]|uniref:C1q domain-containing protein n=1 Tax=Silurus meridionalis TaxID=175797 RepID=A0A8T0BQP1_SILME|nr:complement C1q-like protein 4 [Silurus meridionalis]KAF7709165.1 hypothetical protein HF521_016015 [Silurus meridionalis]
MRALVFLAFFLYQCTVVQGVDFLIELHEVKSILKDQKALLEELKNQGQGNGCSCIAEIRYQLNELKSTVAEQKVKLEALQKQLADKPTVAFSASLIGHGGQTLGGYSTEEILKFQKVFTNVGGAYSSTTGKFTTPVKGVYYFSFTAFANGKSSMGVHLRKNGEQIVAIYDYNSNHKDVNGANRSVLMLEKGDEVYIGLWSSLYIFDSYNSVSTFSGFLIFPSE